MRSVAVLTQGMLYRYRQLIFFAAVFSVIIVLTHVHLNKSKTFSLTNTTVDLKCSDIVLEKSVEYRGNYIVFNNYVQADKKFKCRESITLSAPGDYRFLDNVLPLVDRWRGPISVALYAPGYDFFTTLQCIAYLRKCTTPLVKEFVTFHLLFDIKHLPQSHDRPLLEIYDDDYDCSQKAPYETIAEDQMYKQKNGLFYPINVARNVARLNAQTHFVFPNDIELYPTKNFIQKFFDFMGTKPQYFKEGAKNVFVFPLFEMLAEHKVPENKTELQRMLGNKTAFNFHAKVCPTCHNSPKSKEWIKATETKGLDIFVSAKRQGGQHIWEPFFVCTNKEPLWDERLNWEGQGNKMPQVYSMCILDYNFLVFDNAFLVHKPGIKKTKIQNIKYKDQQKINDAILVHITEELEKFYGYNKECKIH